MQHTKHTSSGKDRAAAFTAMHAGIAVATQAPFFMYDAECRGATPEALPELMRLQAERQVVAAKLADAGLFSRYTLNKRLDALDERIILFPRPIVRWREHVHNATTRVGGGDILDKYFAGSGYTAAWYMLLAGGTGTFATTDTSASHAGWTETTAYNEANRPAISWAASNTGANAVTKASSAACQFTMNAGGTLKGAGVIANNTKGGTTGVLYSVAAFTGGDRTYVSTDVVNVSVTITQNVS